MRWTDLSIACGAVLALTLGFTVAYAAQPAAQPSVSQPAAAPSKPAPKPVAKKAKEAKDAKEAPPSDLLTREQLRACMDQDTRIKSARVDLGVQREALDKDQAEIRREGEALKTTLESLDRTSEPLVTAYQARAAAHDRLIDGYNGRLTPFNTAATALREEELAYTKNCAGRPFEEGDELAIKRGKK